MNLAYRSSRSAISTSSKESITIVAPAVGYQLIFLDTHGVLTSFNVLQARGLQEITNETFDETVKEVEGKFMSVVSCYFYCYYGVNKLSFELSIVVQCIHFFHTQFIVFQSKITQCWLFYER